MRTSILMRMFLISACLWYGVVVEAGAGAGAGAVRRRDYEPYLFAAVPLHAPVPVLRVLSPAPLPVRPRAAHPYRPNASPVQHTPFTRPFAEPHPYADHGYYAESRPYADHGNYAESRPYADHGNYAESRPYLDVRPYIESRPYTESLPYTEPRPYGKTRSFSESRPYSKFRRYSESRPNSESRPYSEVGGYVESRPFSSGRPYMEAVEYHEEGSRPAARELAVEWGGFALPVLGAAAAGSSEEPLGSQEATVLYARPSGSGGYTYRKRSGKKPPKKVASSKEQPVVVKIHKHKIIKS